MIATQTRPAPAARFRKPPRLSLSPERRGRLLAAATIVASVALTLAYVWVRCPIDLAPDEAHYWDWSLKLDWSYYSKGPLVAWLIRGSCELFGGLSLALTGSLAAAVRLPAVVCHGAILVGWYVLAAGVFRSPRLGLAVVALAAVLPVVRIGAVVMTIDPPLLACWCWALVCVWKALEAKKTAWWAGAAACTAFGILAKYTMTLFPAAVVGYLLFHRRGEFRRAGIWVLFAGAVAGWIPIVVWNARHDWVSFRHVFGQVGAGEPSANHFRWLGPATFVGGQIGMMFGLWLVAFLAAAWRFRPTREADPGVRLLWWCAVPVWGLFAAASFVKTGQANWPAPAYVAGFVLAVAWVGEKLAGPNRHHVARCFVVNVVLGLVLVFAAHYPAVLRPLLARLAGPATEEHPIPARRLDLTARLVGWKTLGAEVDAIRARVAAETGREPVLAATYWTLPGQLRFSCAGHPDVYAVGIPNGSDRHSQYDFWRPNPVADAQVFVGRSFVIVGNIGPHLLPAFDRVEPPVRVVHAENGVTVEVWWVWVCHGFRGFGGLGPHDPGY
jgi:4-amino-4-deoxy-L-arabinose transferase-like glycosyltransferase